VIVADIHEDGMFLYPGTGDAEETGKGRAAGTKLNIPMQPGAGDAQFLAAWERVEEFLRAHQPEFILFQCGADSLAGDPLAHLKYTPATHAHAARKLCRLANDMAQGRIMGFGGGGYDRRNLALAWNGVLREFATASDR
jgi:acetoin utilization protein AcuC